MQFPPITGTNFLVMDINSTVIDKFSDVITSFKIYKASTQHNMSMLVFSQGICRHIGTIARH